MTSRMGIPACTHAKLAAFTAAATVPPSDWSTCTDMLISDPGKVSSSRVCSKDSLSKRAISAPLRRPRYFSLLSPVLNVAISYSHVITALS
eukprot:CAMPEP_0119121996 /NCGR_PEP_ID=MMETSP1310-20130426/2388_1 /TAXON_ID=464262 /ORGANISM="Genus nov. species nov., Strain RCC2339" /LENGTH=90 /DNA_ID=CAMNT_0007111597 /DNA_START=30 /DNA_END=299 /DNA_ORIENTATION=-